MLAYHVAFLVQHQNGMGNGSFTTFMKHEIESTSDVKELQARATRDAEAAGAINPSIVIINWIRLPGDDK